MILTVLILLVPDGSVTIPYVGQVVIQDQTKEEAQQFINDVLKDFYQEPETIVKIEAYNSSYVYHYRIDSQTYVNIVVRTTIKIVRFTYESRLR